MSIFVIHPQLLADCHRLGRLDLCHLLLHKNASLPWFILVPQTAASDLLDLPEGQRNTAMQEAAAIAQLIKGHFGHGKINFAAIGNVVAQLHLHVVGRKPGDPCWPAPVWGNLTGVTEYSAEQIAEIRKLLARDYSLRTE